MQRSLLSLSLAPASLLLFLIAPACAPDATSSKQPLAVCQEGDDGCPSVPRAEKKPTSSSNGPSGAPSAPTSTNEEDLTSSKSGDAGTPPADAAVEAEVPLGSLCKALDKCCDQIEQAGYLPDNCRSVVALKHESACYAQHQQYKGAGDCS